MQLLLFRLLMLMIVFIAFVQSNSPCTEESESNRWYDLKINVIDLDSVYTKLFNVFLHQQRPSLNIEQQYHQYSADYYSSTNINCYQRFNKSESTIQESLLDEIYLSFEKDDIEALDRIFEHSLDELLKLFENDESIQ